MSLEKLSSVCGAKLFVFDLDLTLWEHPDISSTSPPYRRLSRDVIVDSTGEVVKLRPCARQLLERLKALGVRTAVASWNYPEPALGALEALGIKELFDVIVVEPHPFKEVMIERILREIGVKEHETVFLDDNPVITARVASKYPNMTVLRFGFDVLSLCDLLQVLEETEREK